MRRLLTFLVRYHYWFLFFILEAASLVLLFKFNGYQQSVLFTSAGEVAGRIYSVENVIKEYLDLTLDGLLGVGRVAVPDHA